MNSSTFWRGKRVLLTGHTGFKGGWLTIWLNLLGANVCGVALPPKSTPNLFDLASISEGIESCFCDIRDFERFDRILIDFQPEVVFHLAAQPLVRASYSDPLGTFSSNIMGTAHLLESMRGLKALRVGVMVTTDKVYLNLDQPYPFREDDVLGGQDPYSASKAACEIVTACFRESFLKNQGIAVATARAGNVMGGGDWSADRLIPDLVRACLADETLDIRRPQAIRPWQHVLEPLKGYLTLAEKLWNDPELAGAYNFGPHTHEAVSVSDVVELARQGMRKGAVRYGESIAGLHEASWLTLETTKARMSLGVKPKWNLAETVKRTIAWYRAQHAGADARELCLAEINEYVSNEA
jgi:CDP-glucose 4,6-dehydratase